MSDSSVDMEEESRLANLVDKLVMDCPLVLTGLSMDVDSATESEPLRPIEKLSIGIQTETNKNLASIEVQTEPDVEYDSLCVQRMERDLDEELDDESEDVKKLTDDIWGCFAATNHQFKKEVEEVDFNHCLKGDTTIIQHFRFNSHSFFRKIIEGYLVAREHLPVYSNDIVIASFPRAGSTWVQEIVYHLHHIDKLDQPLLENIDVRVPLIEFPECTFEVLMNRPSPKLLKTNMPYHLMHYFEGGRKFKTIYIARNPKDVAVSCYHFYKMMSFMQFNGDFETFLTLFCENKVHCSPYLNHVLSYFNVNDFETHHYLTYERLQKDTFGEIKKIARFLNINADDDLLKKIEEKCSFDNMKANPLSNHSQWAGDLNLAKREELNLIRKARSIFNPSRLTDLEVDKTSWYVEAPSPSQ
ncbi:hypothetical protein CHUAL_012155 [Chamberlinius hualienensis]